MVKMLIKLKYARCTHTINKRDLEIQFLLSSLPFFHYSVKMLYYIKLNLTFSQHNMLSYIALDYFLSLGRIRVSG